MKVRRANQKDVQSLSDFVREIQAGSTSHGHSLGKEFFKSMIRSGFVFMCHENKVPIGLLIAEVDARIQFSNILHVVSHPELDGHEINSLLLQKYMDECKKMNIADIAFQTPENEQQTLDFFKKMGFSADEKFVLLTRSI